MLRPTQTSGSSAIDDLRRVEGPADGRCGFGDVGLRTARSMRRTDAPLSARRRPANGLVTVSEGMTTRRVTYMECNVPWRETY